MKITLSISAMLLSLLIFGCGISESNSGMVDEGTEEDEAPTLEEVDAVRYSYPLDNAAVNTVRYAGQGIASVVPGAGTAMRTIGGMTNTNLDHEDVMVVKKYSDGSKEYESVGWGAKFPEQGEVEYFKKLEKTKDFKTIDRQTLNPSEWERKKSSVYKTQKSYVPEDYRVRGNWLSSGWNCQSMAEDVWTIFSPRR